MLEENKKVYEAYKELLDKQAIFQEEVRKVLTESKTELMRNGQWAGMCKLAVSDEPSYLKYVETVKAEIEELLKQPLDSETILDIFKIRSKMVDLSVHRVDTTTIGTRLNQCREFIHDVYLDFYVCQNVAEEDLRKVLTFTMD